MSTMLDDAAELDGAVRAPGGRRLPMWLAIAAASVPMFMAMLDNLVVTSALPSIARGIGADLEQLDWVVNAYSLAFAAFILVATSLGDRIGRRTVFLIGIAVFTGASVLNALSTEPWQLIAARALQGFGAAGVLPLSLTLLAGSVEPRRRPAAIGIWGGVAGLGVALGPLVGGWITDTWRWESIFWLNVPIGIIALPLVFFVLPNSFGARVRADLLGTALAGLGVLGIVFGIIRGNDAGWTSAQVLTGLIGGGVLLVAFVWWQSVARAPLLPLRLFRVRSHTVANIVGLTFQFGVFGSVFILIQFLQVVQGHTPLEAGEMTIPWTMAPMVVAPLTGILLVPRVGPRLPAALGLALSAIGIGWIAWTLDADLTYSQMWPPFLITGVGMGMVFGPSSTALLMDLGTVDHNKASGSNSTLREIGTALGIATLTAVFLANNGTLTPTGYVDAARPAVFVGAAVLAATVIPALFLPGRRRQRALR